MELSVEFFVGAFTVGLFFGGYWLLNKIIKIEDNMYRELADNRRWCTEDLHEAMRKLTKDVDASNTDTRGSIDHIYDELDSIRSDMLDRIRESDHTLERNITDLRMELSNIEKEFDSRIIGESRNMQRMLNVKLNRPETVSESV